MCRFDLTGSDIVYAFALKRNDLCFGERCAGLGNLRFQDAQPQFEVKQLVPEPNRAHPAWGNERTAFAQLI